MSQNDCQERNGSAKCDKLKKEGKCDHSCQCEKCARDQRNDPSHFKGCHCSKEK